MFISYPISSFCYQNWNLHFRLYLPDCYETFGVAEGTDFEEFLEASGLNGGSGNDCALILLR